LPLSPPPPLPTPHEKEAETDEARMYIVWLGFINVTLDAGSDG
jgi:hypothetical protein